MSGVDEISQLSGKPVACVPCSMTPVESASRPMLPSAFPDGVGLHHFLYGAQSHGPQRSLSTLRPWGRPQLRKTRFQLYLRPWLGGIGYPQGFNSRFQLMASSSARLGWRTREAGRRLTIGLISALARRWRFGVARFQREIWSRASFCRSRHAKSCGDCAVDAERRRARPPNSHSHGSRSHDLPVKSRSTRRGLTWVRGPVTGAAGGQLRDQTKPQPASR